MKLKRPIGRKECAACLDFCCKFERNGWSAAPIFLESEYKAIKENRESRRLFKPFGKTGAWQVILKKARKNEYLCPFFTRDSRLCSIEPLKPFDCRFFPFAFMKGEKDGLTYVACFKKNVCSGLGGINKKEFKEYISYLKRLFNSKKGLDFLKNYPQVLDYDADADLIFTVRK